LRSDSEQGKQSQKLLATTEAGSGSDSKQRQCFFVYGGDDGENGGENGGEVEEDVFSDAQERAEPFSVDAANGAELIPEDAALAGGGEDSAEARRQKLVRILGSGCFEKAHARLQKVVEEEDDDALVADIQAILGPERLDKLPMILKLIYLEGGGLF
jgi:hypothetical protein